MKQASNLITSIDLPTEMTSLDTSVDFNVRTQKRQISIMFVSGEIIALLTFPGVIVHEWAHKVCCNIAGVKVLEVKYFRMNSDVAGYVNHEEPNSFKKTFLISFGPIFINTSIAFSLGIISVLIGEAIDSMLFVLLSLWLAVSIGVHALPSSQDARHVIQAASEKRKSGISVILFLVYPFVWALYIMNMLRVIWFDFILGLFIVGLGAWLGERLLAAIS